LCVVVLGELWRREELCAPRRERPGRRGTHSAI
jgi:hypothetical protein